MKDEYKNVIGIDFQGWPIFKRNLREILISLGADYITTEDGRTYLAFEDTDLHLDAFPKVLEDDGMGYGVNERMVTEVGPVIYTNENVFNIFVDKSRPEEIKKFHRELEELERIKKKRNEKGE